MVLCQEKSRELSSDRGENDQKGIFCKKKGGTTRASRLYRSAQKSRGKTHMLYSCKYSFDLNSSPHGSPSILIQLRVDHFARSFRSFLASPGILR